MESNNKLNLIADRYAQTLIQLTNEGKITPAKTMEDLADICKALEETPDLEKFFSNPAISAEDKKDIIDKVFSQSISAELTIFLKVLIDKNRFYVINTISDEYKKLLDNQNNIKRVEVVSAVEVRGDYKIQIKQKLEEKLKKQVEITWNKDPEIIAGLLIKIDDNVIDTSLKQKIEDFRKNIVRI